VQFHLITTSILFLSREGFRRGCLRIQEEEQQQAGKVRACVKACLFLGRSHEPNSQQRSCLCPSPAGPQGSSSSRQRVTVIERVLAVSWLVLPIGAAVASAVCGFVLWRSQAADTTYRQAVVAHGELWWPVGMGRDIQMPAVAACG
jgi:oligosaccharide translocation protein RFT1